MSELREPGGASGMPVASEHPATWDAAVSLPEQPALVMPTPESTSRPPITTDKGVCPVKAEYLRPAPARVSLDAEGRTRGMNKGTAREHSEFVQGTQRPTWEGEQNFFFGATLQKIKKTVREAKQRQPKQQQEQQQSLVSKDGAVPAETTSVETTEQTAAAVAAEEGELLVVGQKRERSPSAEKAPITAVPALDATTKFNSDEPTARPSHTEESLREVIARQSSSRGLFSEKLVLAPLTTVGNLPFRRICKSFGADVTLSEMAVVFNLNRLQKSEWSLLRRHESEDIFGIQLAVSRPQEAATFAQVLEASGFSYDFLDINCGCPVEKLVKSGCGCGLWERTGRLRDVVENLAIHQSRPVTIKCRIGFDEEMPTLHQQIHQYSTWGAAAVTVHGRSRKQRYTKFANWDYVDQCAQLSSLPVIGNGDIMSLEDVLEHRRRQPHITSHMIGRGALIKPWLFEEIKSGQVKDISSSERLDMLREFCGCGMAHWGSDERGVMATRRFLCEWLSFLHRYVPVGLLERLPQRINERPPFYEGRNELETLMSSDSVTDWIRISELLLGPVEKKFRFTPKHKSNSYENAAGLDGDLRAEG
ncbi:Dihydrouridine synthase (Dus), putative [Leishmania lindenbergi]|uniref:tRNA-dihydrouridine(47) synthase [NAD(P)(+)] n=1 Tax=Leishmania lindenbergi TaxID=651832 RepID=A0AAW3AKM1_9TRYP